MDNFRRYKAPHRAPGAVDGFIGGGSARQRPSARQYEIGSTNQVRLDTFRNSDGFRPNTQPRLTTPAAPPAKPLASAERIAPADMRLSQPGGKKARTKRRRLHPALRVLGVIFLIGLLGGGYFIGRTYFAVNGVFGGGGSAPALAETVDISTLKGEGDGRVNVLLLGIGGQGHEAPDLTDTMMLASIDPVNNKAGLLSIPRDLWVKMPNNYIANEQKINAAYESGKYNFLGKQDAANTNREAILAGFESADKVVEEVLGVPVHYNILVDFRAFEQAIDTVGGVSFDVPEALVDPTMAWENNGNQVLAAAGTQTFDGKKTLMYVRSRATSSDFARAERQRAVMVALKNKVFTLGTLSNPVKISNLISAFGNNVVSDLSVADAARVVEIMQKIPNDNIQSVGLGDDTAKLITTATVNGVSIVKPVAGLFAYTEIQSYARNILKDGFLQQEDANIAVYNGWTVAGLAGKRATDLQSYGYKITTVGNAPTKNYTKTVIVDLTNNQKKVTKYYLEQRFGVTAVTTMPDATIPTDGSDFVIILGQNESAT